WASSPIGAAQPQETLLRRLSRARPARQRKRQRNSNPPNELGVLSPKTRQATPSDTRQHAPPQATAPVALSRRQEPTGVTPNACPASPYGSCRPKRAKRH